MRFQADVRTMALVDLVGYSPRAAARETAEGPQGVAQFNADIQAVVDAALGAAGLRRADHVVMTTGDGGLLSFAAADPALAFAAALHAAARDAQPEWRLRVGIATGEVAIDTEATQGNGLGGMAITRAARLEAKADPGGVLIDAQTWSAVADLLLRAPYNGPEPIPGKHAGEAFDAYRARFNPLPSPPADIARAERRALVERIDRDSRRVTGVAQVQMLEERLQIPHRRRPPDTLDIERRLAGILTWASREERLADMADHLQAILAWD